jgi:hypothetical protein
MTVGALSSFRELDRLARLGEMSPHKRAQVHRFTLTVVGISRNDIELRTHRHKERWGVMRCGLLARSRLTGSVTESQPRSNWPTTGRYRGSPDSMAKASPLLTMPGVIF